jgi:hypothetical protein
MFPAAVPQSELGLILSDTALERRLNWSDIGVKGWREVL